MDRYALIGHPVAHSRSAAIHRAFAAQSGERIGYELLDVPAQRLAAAVGQFLEAGGRGLNFTVPHKERASALVDELSERARLAGAVNTLVLDGVRRCGENTDGIGLVRDLANRDIALGGRRILLIGAGGAARGVIGPLLECRPARLHIANRTADRGEALATQFAPLGPVSAGGLGALGGDAYDLIINATSAGLTGPLPPLPRTLVGPQTCCYDMLYADTTTPFLQWAAGAGAPRTAAGWGMLVEQAAEAYTLWRGWRPQTAPVIAALVQGRLK